MYIVQELGENTENELNLNRSKRDLLKKEAFMWKIKKKIEKCAK